MTRFKIVTTYLGKYQVQQRKSGIFEYWTTVSAYLDNPDADTKAALEYDKNYCFGINPFGAKLWFDEYSLEEAEKLFEKLVEKEKVVQAKQDFKPVIIKTWP